MNDDFFWFFIPQHGDGGVSGAQFIVHDDVQIFISGDDVVEQLLNVYGVIKAYKGARELVFIDFIIFHRELRLFVYFLFII